MSRCFDCNKIAKYKCTLCGSDLCEKCAQYEENGASYRSITCVNTRDCLLMQPSFMLEALPNV